MTLEQIAQQHYRRSSLTTRQVVAAVLELWRATGPSGFRDELVRAARLVAAGQLSQAVQAADYVDAMAVEQGLDLTRAARLVPRSLAGVSADGRPLTDVLSYPIDRAATMMDAGADLATAELSATASLTRIVSNEVTQAGVTAESVAIAGNPAFKGYIRILTAPSCGRCAVLAGKWFKWNQGFKRHPGCDCKHVPAADADAVSGMQANPKQYFDSLSEAEQNRRFGAAEAEAIRNGSSVSDAVNTGGVRSGLSSPSRVRLPDDRAAAVDRLVADGYLTPPEAPVRSAGFRFDPADVPRTGSTDPLPGSDDWLATLTDDEVDALRRYTGKGSDLSADTINHKLGGGDPLDPAQARAVALIDSAIAKADGAIRTDVPLYRGVERWIPPGPRIGLSEADIIDMIADDVEKDYPVGSVVKLNQSWQPLGRDRPGSGGFASTSTDVTPALDASVNREAPGLIFEIAPTPGAPLQAVTKYDDEFEVLLGRDEKFRVVAVHRRVEFWDSGGDSRYRTVVQVERVR